MGELEKVLGQLNKKFDKDYINFYGKSSYKDYVRRSFGITALDFRTGGGVPQSKVVTIAGKYSAGKSTTSLSMIASVQKKGEKVVLLDTEASFDPIWAQKFGVDLDKLIVCHPETIEEVTDTIEPLLCTNELGLVVFDSVAATTSKKELEESAEKKSMGGIAWEVGLLMRKIVARLKHCDTSVLIINQLRDNVSGYGANEYMPGGQQLKNQSDIMIYLRSGDWIGSKDAPTGITIKFRVSKNKTAPPLQTGSFDLLFEGRIDNKKSLVEEAIRQGIVGKAGAWFYYQDENNKSHGLETFMETLDDKLFTEIKEKTLNKIKGT